jgi:predicted DNA-binding transcriptional regulator AlpA
MEINVEQENVWLEPQEVADYLGISLSQVYRYMKQTPPPWPYYRVTITKKLSKKSDLDAWLEKVKVSA